MAQLLKAGLVRGHDKPIHGTCAIYFPGGIMIWFIIQLKHPFINGRPWVPGISVLPEFCAVVVGICLTFVPHLRGVKHHPWRRFVSALMVGTRPTVCPVCNEQGCSICREEAVTTRRSYWGNGAEKREQLPPPRSSPLLRQGVLIPGMVVWAPTVKKTTGFYTCPIIYLGRAQFAASPTAMYYKYSTENLGEGQLQCRPSSRWWKSTLSIAGCYRTQTGLHQVCGSDWWLQRSGCKDAAIDAKPLKKPDGGFGETMIFTTMIFRTILLGGGLKYFLFSPWSLGRWSQFDLRIFFRWVGEKPRH